ncbi:MAG: HAD family hydrolase [Gammaproteobacteria bacterium]|nr:HAD family hydrolase [Gammaproteobacteria bacterium]
MINPFTGILFDFDGTLVPNLDLPALKRGVIEFTVKYGVPREEVEDKYIIELVDHAAEWLRQRDADADRYHQFANQIILDAEIEAAARTTLFPGVEEVFRHVRAKNIRTGIVTRNCEKAVKMMFGDVHDYCDALVARDHVEALKPDKRHMQLCLDMIGCQALDVAMVGDGASDMQAGKTMGMFCIGVLTGSSDRSRLIDAGADLVLDHVTQLVEIEMARPRGSGA